MRRILSFLAASVLLNGQLGAANEFYGDFQGAVLLVDTKVESPATYDNSSSVASPEAGETIEFQLFVPLAAGRQTLGYNLEFSAIGFDILEAFSFSGRDFFGSPLMVTVGEPVISAILISRPEYPSNGYIGTVTLTARHDIPPGTSVFLTGRTSLADANSQEDLLDVSQAFVTLVDANFVPVIPGDLDLNGSVDFSDFLTFASNFGRSGPIPSPVTARTIIIRDTIEIVRVDTIIVIVNEGSPLSAYFWQGPFVFADVDIQLGDGDGFNSGASTVDASFNELVSIEIFAKGYGLAIGMEAQFRVSDPSRISGPYGSSEVFRISLPMGFGTRSGVKGNNLSFSAGSLSGGITEVGSGLKHFASVTFRALGPVDIAFISFEIAWSATDIDRIYPNIVLEVR